MDKPLMTQYWGLPSWHVFINQHVLGTTVQPVRKSAFSLHNLFCSQRHCERHCQILDPNKTPAISVTNMVRGCQVPRLLQILSLNPHNNATGSAVQGWVVVRQAKLPRFEHWLWICHQAVLDSGSSPTINYCKISMTYHKVLFLAHITVQAHRWPFMG